MEQVYKVRDPQGNVREIRGPAGASDEQVLAKAKELFSAPKPDMKAAIENDAISQGAKNFNADSGFLSNVAAGAGKALSDVGLGIRQIVGNASQKEVDETAQRDKALMSTGGGMTGNIGAQVGMSLLPGGAVAGAGKLAGAPALQAAGRLALAPTATLAGAGAGAASGALQGAVQPVESGQSRVVNSMIGGAGGAAFPVIGMAAKGAKAVVEPLYAGGRDTIVGRAMNSAVGNSRDDVINAMMGARELVPGSKPTAAEVANSGGIAAMQRAAAAVDPEAYAVRKAAQNDARVAALEGMKGNRQAAVNARTNATDALYEAAKGQTVKIDAEMNNLMARPSMKQAWAKAQKLAAEKGEQISFPGMAAKEVAAVGADGVPVIAQQGAKEAEASVKGLHYLKLALDDILENPAQNAIGRNEARAISANKDSFLSWLEGRIPEYGQARETFKAMSKPVNQIDVLEEVAKKSVHPLTGTLQPNSFARSLTDETAQRATGFDRARLADVMSPGQMRSLEAIKKDLARSVMAQNLGRGAGSDTVQKMAMTNLMQRSGLPLGLMNLPGIGRAANWAYSQTDDLMKQRLADAMLNPQEAAGLMKGAVPSPAQQKIIEAIMRAGTAGTTGATMSGLNQ